MGLISVVAVGMAYNSRIGSQYPAESQERPFFPPSELLTEYRSRLLSSIV